MYQTFIFNVITVFIGLSLEDSMREKQNIIMICGVMIQKVKNGQKFMVSVKNHPLEDATLQSA